MAAYDSLNIGDTITVTGLSSQFAEVNGTYTIFSINTNPPTSYTYNLSGLINERDMRISLYIYNEGPNALENFPSNVGDSISFYPQAPPDDNDSLYFLTYSDLSAFNWYDLDNETSTETIVNFPNWLMSWNGVSWGPGAAAPSEPTFGLPADVVALITSRFGTVANFLRLRNQGQV